MNGFFFFWCGKINGDECAASFAYYAFFSLFPLILLMVAMGTFFIPDRYQAAHQVVLEVERYVPLQAKDRELLFTIVDHAIKNGWRAGIFGLFALLRFTECSERSWDCYFGFIIAGSCFYWGAASPRLCMPRRKLEANTSRTQNDRNVIYRECLTEAFFITSGFVSEAAVQGREINELKRAR